MEPQAGRRISPFRATKRSNHSLRKTTRRSRVHVQTIGTECRNKKVSAPSRRRDMSLDIAFYRTSPVMRLYREVTPPSPDLPLGRGSVRFRGGTSETLMLPRLLRHLLLLR